ncbi:ricin-type beta-trefoil lectin domain protein [Dactylosporangium sp. CA-139114]|uniref:RICIN domain-containing protein n=1 Tax=Dactylosporangium sp. CA-139114 TaxID=3239931 RepID=UPI003D97F98D
MSVAGDGDNAGDSGAQPPLAGPLPPAAGPNPRHRVPPTASAAARVLPEPFTPPKPTIPAVPHQRRPDGPTAVAMAPVPVRDDEPDPSPVATLAGERRADAANLGDAENLAFIVSLPGISNDPELTADPSPAPDPSPTADPSPAVDSESAVDPESAADPAPAVDPEPADETVVETVEGELLPVGPVVPADDSPTVADYRAPALAIVTDYDHEDAQDYRGSRRRRVMPWKKYPVGAVAVAVLLLLITGAVVFQAMRGDGSGGNDNALPGQVPGVDMPGGRVPVGAAGASPSASAEATDDPATDAAAPTTTRAHAATTAPAASQPASPSTAPPTVTRTTTPPPPVQPTQGRLMGAQSRKCLEYRPGSANRVVIDACGDAAQVFRVQGNAATGATLLADNGYCLDVVNRDTANGTPVQVYPCNGTPAQVFVRRSDNTWQNPNAKRCLTAAGTGSGSIVVIWDCAAAPSQIWTMQ